MAYGVGVGTSTDAVWVLQCGYARCKTGVNGWKMGCGVGWCADIDFCSAEMTQ